MELPKNIQHIARDSYVSDIRYLAQNLRPDDLKDIQKITGNNPLLSLFHGYKHSMHCITFHRPHNPKDVVGMGGVVSNGIVWTLFHKDFLQTKEDRRVFLRACMPVLNFFKSQLKMGQFLHNVTLTENTQILRWLKWLGAHTFSTDREDITYFQFFNPMEDIHV